VERPGIIPSWRMPFRYLLQAMIRCSLTDDVTVGPMLVGHTDAGTHLGALLDSWQEVVHVLATGCADPMHLHSVSSLTMCKIFLSIGCCMEMIH